ncbi:MAG TPA: DUF695 domain-containing protein [Micromonosporaceae bacterium]|nr:DUF695 domain-containing protein [Micromonosporaceae bacterium]
MIFRRRAARTGSVPAIADFWAWWSGAHARVQQAIESGDAGTLVTELSRHVKAIHPDLEWEFARGSRSRHALIVSPGGDARIRAVAARWLAEAPAPDEIWEYHRSRQADATALSATIEAGGHKLDLADLRFAFTVDSDRRGIDVTAHHPGFADVPEGMRGQVTFLALDWALGEDAVEVWVGAVDWSTTPVPDPRSPAELAAAVAELAAPGKVWAMIAGRDGSRAAVVASVQVPLRSARWPQYDTHVRVLLPYRTATDEGLPVDASLTALRDLEDRLCADLDVDGELVAHESGRGRRILHFYVDGAGTGARTLRDGIRDWPEGRADAKPTYDPEFKQVAHLS